MYLTQLVEGLNCGSVCFEGEEWEREIDGLYMDSREVKEKGLFVCLTGGKADGHEFAYQAVQSGAVALVVERLLPIRVPQILVPSTRVALPYLASKFYGDPSAQLKIIGVTGTNGKTTTTHLLAGILRRAGKQVATIGTLGITYGRKKIETSLTTPDPIVMQKAYADMVACGVEYVVEEVSAHALYHKKDSGTYYTACIFTNLTQDHLDFFKDMESYKSAKISLFEKDKCDLAIVNADDKVSDEIKKIRIGSKVTTYGLKEPADCFAVLTDEGLLGQSFVLNLEDDLCRVSLHLTGKHNAYNALAAATCAYKLGINVPAIACGLNEVKQVSGRLQFVQTYKGASIFVDFAHTPDGLKHSLTSLKKHTVGRLICLFGCGGNRDKGKRPLMGEETAKLADFSILTSDNPRFEDPLDIITDIETGVKKHSNKYVIVPNRERAIEYAVSMLQAGDVLLVAGKGGEETQEIMGIKYPYNDQDVVRKMVSQANSLR